MADPAPEQALAAITRELSERGRRFALVGGLAVSVRAEVRFTRDVDVAVLVSDDADAEQLIYELRQRGYQALATVEHETQHRLSTVRLLGSDGVKVDLIFATSGIEPEIIDGATSVEVAAAGSIPVAAAEELVAMKVLSMTDVRLQDRLDAQRILQLVPELDLARVRADLVRIGERGFDRGQDLNSKFDALLRAVGIPS
jgi:predicted nucleotidyltransferase